MKDSISIIDLSDPRTFEQTFSSHYSSLCAFAFHYTEDHEMAEEIVQAVFSTVWENRQSIKITTNVKSYLVGAVRNAGLNYLKHQRVKGRYKEQQLLKPTSDETDFLELAELLEIIECAMESLPKKCREIFEMSRYREMKYHQIAAELNISVKTVETQISRALKVMRKALRHYH